MGQKQSAIPDRSDPDPSRIATASTASAGQEPWPDIFGSYQPAPPAPPPSKPTGPAVNHDYTLRGLFASTANSWAIVADPGGEYLLRAGDELPGGALVAEITEQGVWLEIDGSKELIAFDDE